LASYIEEKSFREFLGVKGQAMLACFLTPEFVPYVNCSGLWDRVERSSTGGALRHASVNSMKDFAYQVFITNQCLAGEVTKRVQRDRVDANMWDLADAYMSMAHRMEKPWLCIHGCRDLVAQLNRFRRDAMPDGDRYFGSDLDGASKTFIDDLIDYLHAAGAPVKRLDDLEAT
jgi:hypothetical protein